MRGLIFVEFLSMVEAQYSEALVEELIDRTAPPSGGAYTRIGTYDVRELVALVGALSEHTKEPVPSLLEAFGRHSVGAFVAGYPELFSAYDDTLSFVERIEDHIHVEVRKLYPDAELPHFDASRGVSGDLHLRYRSQRGLADFARGMIQGCAEHYGDRIHLLETDNSAGARRDVSFVLSMESE
jgi:hypothetical protein